MSGIEFELNNREIALLAWLGVLAVFAVIVARNSLRSIFDSLRNWVIPCTLLALTGYTAGVVFLLERIGLWDGSMFMDTLVWLITAGVVAVFKSVTITDKAQYFKSVLWDSLKLTIVVEFVLDTYVLPLGWEMAVIPFLFLLACMLVLAESQKEHKVLVGQLQSAINIIVAGLLAYSAIQLVDGWREFASLSTLRSMVLAPLLTVLAIPFYLVLTIWSEYQQHFILIDCWLKDKPALQRHAKWRSLAECRTSFRRLQKLRPHLYMKLEDCKDKSSIKAAVKGLVHAPDPVHLPGEVVSVRIAPHTISATGQIVQKVMVDWRNKSDRPVAAAYADIDAFDADGNLLESGAKDYCIFSHEDNGGVKVQPGEVCRKPDELGFVLLSNAFGEAARVESRIVKLLEF